jgi:hypothetical protein
MKYTVTTILSAALLAATTPALAYVGPGAGLSLIGAFWALILAVATALFFLVAWPLRRMLRQSRARGHRTDTDAAPARSADEERDPLAK